MTAPANTAEKAKHTPGPWSVVNGGPHWNNPAITNYQITRPIGARTYHVAWSPDGELVAEHVYEESDALLIAAAPELLEALAYALPYLRATVPNPRNGVNPDCTPDVNCVDRAIAAIAKATGATP